MATRINFFLINSWVSITLEKLIKNMNAILFLIFQDFLIFLFLKKAPSNFQLITIMYIQLLIFLNLKENLVEYYIFKEDLKRI